MALLGRPMCLHSAELCLNRLNLQEQVHRQFSEIHQMRFRWVISKHVASN